MIGKRAFRTFAPKEIEAKGAVFETIYSYIYSKFTPHLLSPSLDGKFFR